jgi:hypothetical protein
MARCRILIVQEWIAFHHHFHSREHSYTLQLLLLLAAVAAFLWLGLNFNTPIYQYIDQLDLYIIHE